MYMVLSESEMDLSSNVSIHHDVNRSTVLPHPQNCVGKSILGMDEPFFISNESPAN